MPIKLQRFERGSERGEIGSSLIVLVLVVQAVFLVIHASLVFHGRQVAAAAAQQALHETQLLRGDTAAGKAAGQEFLAISKSLSDSAIDVDRGDETVTVTVTGTINTSLMPFADDVNVTLVGPVERFSTELDRQ